MSRCGIDPESRWRRCSPTTTWSRWSPGRPPGRTRATLPRLVLAGLTAPKPDDWECAVQLGIADDIQVRIGVSDDELRDLYRGASLFLLSSDEEGLGVVLLEAMASGLPVVATRC